MSGRFDIKTDRVVDTAQSRIFQFQYASFPFIVIGKLFLPKILRVAAYFNYLLLAVLFRKYHAF